MIQTEHEVDISQGIYFLMTRHVFKSMCIPQVGEVIFVARLGKKKGGILTIYKGYSLPIGIKKGIDVC